MAIMMGSLYEALVQGGATVDTAKRAAEEVAAYDNQITRIRGELNLLKWMVGFNLALTAAVLAKLLV